MSIKARIFAIVTLLSLVADQLTKIWVNQNIREYSLADKITIIPGYFDIIHAENPGAAFSLFATLPYRQYLFIVFALIAVFVIWHNYRQLPPDSKMLSAAMGLIIGGAFGNAIDRMYKGTVTDFIRIHAENPPLSTWLDSLFGTHEYPTFNIADCTLLVGILLAVFWPQPKPAEQSTTPAPSPEPTP